MIEIIFNGERTILSQSFPIRDLFDHLELDPDVVAAEVNREVVLRPQLAERCLRNGDVVEIVTLVARGAEDS